MESALGREELQDEDKEILAVQNREIFPYETIVVATNNFSHKLGLGLSGSVYKGKLGDGRKIAVKKLPKKSEKEMNEFTREDKLLTALRHPNLVKLVGYAVAPDSEPVLVYKFLPSTSLEKHLISIWSLEGEQIKWEERYKIIEGTAKGLKYLHGSSQNCIIIHRNINPSNILVDDEWRPIIVGFSKACQLDEDKAHVHMSPVGTWSNKTEIYKEYIAPEYWKHGHLSKKTDIYSFGILVLQLISGTRSGLTAWVKSISQDTQQGYRLYEKNRISSKLVGTTIANSTTIEQVANCIKIGLLCVQDNPHTRPNMDHVVSMLEGDQSFTEMQIGKPGWLGYKTSDVNSQQSQPLQDVYQAFRETRQNEGNEFKEVNKHQIQCSWSNSNQNMKEDAGSQEEHKDENLKEKLAAQNCQKFSYETLDDATNKFAPQNKLGQGGFGAVYKGKLDDKREIAVKKSLQSLQPEISERQRKSLIREVELLSSVKHPNVVKLFGYCFEENECLLVYEYVPNKSLDKLLFGPNGRDQQLDWTRTFNIIIGIANGLSYLHADPQNCIIHRDIKPENILLDHQWVPKVADFGISRLFEEDQSHVTTSPNGTFGYTAPECLQFGQLSTMSDVYSFGVLLLELVSGKRYNFVPPPQDNALGLLDWAYKHFKAGKTIEIMDPALADSVIIEQVKNCIKIGLRCVQGYPKSRPHMKHVVSMLTLNQIRREISIGKPGIFGFNHAINSSFEHNSLLKVFKRWWIR